MALQYLYHVDLEVDGQSHVIRHVVLSHVHDVVQLVRNALLHGVFVHWGHVAARQGAARSRNHSWMSFSIETAGQTSEEEQVVALLPGQHGGVGVVGLLSLPVLVHGRTDLALHLYEVVHGVEHQLDVGSLQPNQMVWLRRNRTATVRQKIWQFSYSQFCSWIKSWVFSFKF